MIEELFEKQKQLMEQVPHKVTRSSYDKMCICRSIMERLLLYLNSCGHKPWRPIPLPEKDQEYYLGQLDDSLRILRTAHITQTSAVIMPDELGRKIISAFGVIEEVLEYLASTVDRPREEQLEEITDPLFFWLELAILGGFTWAEIEKEYNRKHAVNLERYRRAKEGDYGWNKRGEGGL